MSSRGLRLHPRKWGWERPQGAWPGQRGGQEGRQGVDSYKRTGGWTGGLEAAKTEAGVAVFPNGLGFMSVGL